MSAIVHPERLSLSIGPLLYHWSRPAVMDFYADVAESAADTVVLGEAVCSRRRELKLDDWLALGQDLRSTGKEVVLVSQTLIESESDLRLLRRQAVQHDFMLEAGDAAALRLLAGTVPFVLGPHINIYNRPALQEHAALGAWRWVAPLELSLDAVASINPPRDRVQALDGAPIATEVFAFGRMPLAFSARCFTARHHHLNKDECEFRCLGDTDGLLLSSSEGQPFLVLNGTQTQSASHQCLIDHAAALRAAGVTRLRLSPTPHAFAAVIDCFERVMNQGTNAAEGLREIEAVGWVGGLSNGFAHRRPGLDWVAA